MSGKRPSPSALSTALARNHNHTPTVTHAHNSFSHLSPTSTHNSCTTSDISDRLNMPLPPTPPAEQTKRGTSGEPPTATAAKPGAAKFGASPTAPSFAAVVSSSTAASAKSPLHPMSFSSSISSAQHHQDHQQKQEHAQSSANPVSSTHIPPTATSAIDAGYDAQAHVRSASGSFSNSSKYHSPLANSPSSANTSHDSSGKHSAADSGNTGASVTSEGRRDLEHDNDFEGNESSDVEIYLDTLGLHNSAARMHVLVGAGDVSSNSGHLQPPSQGRSQVLEESPILPASSHFPSHDHQQPQGGSVSSPNLSSGLRVTNSKLTDNSSNKSLSPLPLSPQPVTPNAHSQPQQQQQNLVHINQARSPQLPPAPVRSTILLPQMDEGEYRGDADAHQLQHLHRHQQMHAHEHQTVVHGAPIDLSGLSLNTSMHAPRQHQHSLGLPSSQSQPMLSVNTSFDQNSPCSPSPTSGFPTSNSDSALASMGQKTPNVYINGLPPHFPEDQLFALASPFGEIRSVRTFTRHVRDSESGYGFVLFETIEAAERCIISLRRYRNLHPTFSKQIHKIPGTTYAQGALPPSSASSWDEQGPSGGSSVDGSSGGSLAADASFKAKMESLHDPTSTNLYMEGLPLSIDEPTLSALVSPHRISSSRFFQTRLSNPPRIIAFVRLETRAGAEEIIERLHGRMVRGWNDTGSRISVRFADTSEQRELRRTERSTQEGDGSPARLTIAQAALLNLRGQDLRTGNSGPVIHAHQAVGSTRIPSGPRAGGFATPDFASTAHLPPTVGNGGSGGLEVDYSLAPGRGAMSGPTSRSRSPYDMNQGQVYQQDQYANPQLAHGHSPSTMDPAMVSLLDSLRSSGVPYQGGSAGGYVDQVSGDLEYMQNQRLGQGRPYQLATGQSMDNLHQYSRPAPAYTRSGYTATEEYIMRAHAESAALAHAQAQQQHQQQQSAAAERRRPAPLDLRRQRGGDEAFEDPTAANISVGVRAYRAQASIGRIGHGVISPPMTSSSMGSLASMASSPGVAMGNVMGDGDFHPSSAGVRNDFRNQLRSVGPVADDNGDGDSGRAVGSAVNARNNPNIHPPHVNARLSREPSSSSSQYQQHQQVQHPTPLSPPLTSPSNHESPNPNDLINYQHAAAHMRSTTLPQHRSSSVRDGHQQMQSRGHFQHSSMSMPAQNLRTPQHASVAKLSGAGGLEGSSTSGVIYDYENQEVDERQRQHHQQQQRGEIGGGNGTNNNVTGSNSSSNTNAPKSHYSTSPGMFGDNQSSTSSPSLISPTLTYSSQTPSTLSPATPFFGSFNSQTEGFEKGAGLDPPSQKKSLTHLNPSSLRSLSGN